MRKLSVFLISCLVFPAIAQAESIETFKLPSSGCSMSHCDQSMSDLTAMTVPSTNQLVAVDQTGLGGNRGVGCVSNTRLVACARYGAPPAISTLVVYDADGNTLWSDNGIFTSNTTWTSAPIIGDDNTVIAADQDWLIRVDALSGQVLWQSAKPDKGIPISPVLVGADKSMILLATSTNTEEVAELSIWDVASGALLSHGAITDPVTGKIYVTQNTPSVKGNRAYILTSAVDDPADGRLYAVDVCSTSTSCVRGSFKPVWYYEFKGPSGASPDVIGSTIYFDGRPTLKNGMFLAITDRGASARLLWRKVFPGKFYSSAAQDPRGGLWLYPALSNTLLRLNQNTGEIEQQVEVGTTLKLDPSYSPASIITVSKTADNGVALVFGSQSFSVSGLPSYLVALDVSSTAAGSEIWKYQLNADAAVNAPVGQYPIVKNAEGKSRIVFNGSKTSTYFVGEP